MDTVRSIIRGLNPKYILNAHLGHYIGCVGYDSTLYILLLFKEKGIIWGLAKTSVK